MRRQAPETLIVPALASLGAVAVVLSVGGCAPVTPRFDGPLRVATFNIEDIRTADLLRGDNPRLIEAAKIIQRLDADILLINEITYDLPEVTGNASRPAGSNAARFVEHYLGREWEPGLAPIAYTAWMPPTNTGIASGFDLDNDGTAVQRYPPVATADAQGTPPRQTSAERAYGNDAWGFGSFPGQYGMALLVKPGLRIRVDEIATFQLFRWSALAEPSIPVDSAGRPWYTPEERAAMRLSSKTHAAIPVEVPGFRTVTIVASHPTPPAFDGVELRNKRRNRDEIRLIARILDADPAVVSDQGRPAAIGDSTAFVVMGDLNADPDEGNAIGDPIGEFLLRHPRVQGDVVPVAAESTLVWYPALDADDTARWGLRVDYVLPSVGLRVVGKGVVRTSPRAPVVVSDHFPVYIDIDTGVR